MHVDYPLPPSYTKFGRVIEGQEVVDVIAEVETDQSDKPISPVVMEKVIIKDQKA
jgi:cyclophilin family peptidyl-prolyl cis-trans isomerase